MYLYPFWRDVVDFIYPGRCAFCESECPGHDRLCPGCERQLETLEREPGCDLCGKPLAVEGDPCPWCEGKGEAHFERVVRLGIYRDPIRHLIYHMKYRGRWALAEFFADRMLRQQSVRSLLEQADCLLPVPLHRFRRISRGYNQSDLIARRLSRHLGRRRTPVVAPLVRLRHTETQTKLHSRARREQNLEDAFGLVAPEQVAGKHILIIDDVMTTGTTLLMLARALKPARPASLSVAVVAIADPKGTDFEAI